ncbi:hypothetical protein Poly51_50210 [Rubripirellula tenax]|uniref:Uncharacterized protein n=1 Tax=Rubripirellula tenax TaxID=2528015 RepID=A0A5C6EDW0_9BACT|nr:hypothetical protein Poly51_50210 [Rubripirellula tenax]
MRTDDHPSVADAKYASEWPGPYASAARSSTSVSRAGFFHPQCQQTTHREAFTIKVSEPMSRPIFQTERESRMQANQKY